MNNELLAVLDLYLQNNILENKNTDVEENLNYKIAKYLQKNPDAKTMPLGDKEIEIKMDRKTAKNIVAEYESNLQKINEKRKRKSKKSGKITDYQASKYKMRKKGKSKREKVQRRINKKLAQGKKLTKSDYAARDRAEELERKKPGWKNTPRHDTKISENKILFEIIEEIERVQKIKQKIADAKPKVQKSLEDFRDRRAITKENIKDGYKQLTSGPESRRAYIKSDQGQKLEQIIDAAAAVCGYFPSPLMQGASLSMHIVSLAFDIVQEDVPGIISNVLVMLPGFVDLSEAGVFGDAVKNSKGLEKMAARLKKDLYKGVIKTAEKTQEASAALGMSDIVYSDRKIGQKTHEELEKAERILKYLTAVPLAGDGVKKSLSKITKQRKALEKAQKDSAAKQNVSENKDIMSKIKNIDLVKNINAVREFKKNYPDKNKYKTWYAHPDNIIFKRFQEIAISSNSPESFVKKSKSFFKMINKSLPARFTWKDWEIEFYNYTLREFLKSIKSDEKDKIENNPRSYTKGFRAYYLGKNDTTELKKSLNYDEKLKQAKEEKKAAADKKTINNRDVLAFEQFALNLLRDKNYTMTSNNKELGIEDFMRTMFSLKTSDADKFNKFMENKNIKQCFEKHKSEYSNLESESSKNPKPASTPKPKSEVKIFKYNIDKNNTGVPSNLSIKDQTPEDLFAKILSKDIVISESTAKGNLANQKMVAGIQYSLFDLGYLKSKDDVDGDFGPKTAAAVKKFQVDHGLDDDEKVGENTIKKIIQKVKEEKGLKEIKRHQLRAILLEMYKESLEEKKKRRKKSKRKKKKKSGGGLSKKTKETLRKKAQSKGYTPGSVYSEYRKGLGAYYSSGSRKGMSAHQWAMARVNSAMEGGKSWATVKKSKAKKK